MSKNSDTENNQLTLLDVLGFPSEPMLFNFNSKSLIYSIGSNIIQYNLATNSKTFVQYLSHEIILLKFLDKQEKLLVTIDNSPAPVICIWELPHFEQIFFKEIVLSSEKNFTISNIFFEQIYQDIYLICITSEIGINYLFVLNNENDVNNGYNVELFGRISGINEEIYGFKIFYNCSDAIFLLENKIVYYNIDLDQENISEKLKKDFPFRLIKNSLQISKDINIISFLTIKGNCLMYDQNGNNKPSINPVGQEYFITCQLNRESICLGTNNGKIYIYNIYDNRPKYFINYNSILKLRHNYQLNLLNKYSEYFNYYTSEEYDLGVKLIYFNEKNDEIFLRFVDNSILLCSLSLLLKESKNEENDFSRNNNYFYSFNHSKKIDDIIIKDNDNSVIYSCSKDQKIIKYNIEYETNKLINSFFNLKEILNNNKFSGPLNPNNNNNNNLNYNDKDTMIYLTVIKCHPIYNSKLFAGDNKGYLYLFDTKENKFQYKRLILETYEIVFLNFNPEGDLLCIGFDTGCTVLCNMKNNCQICLWLNNHYMPVEESEFRKINNHIICFSYFFKNKENRDNCILYLKNNYIIEYCKLYSDNNALNKRTIKSNKLNNKILDIKVHSSENYTIILNDINQVIILQINSGIISGVLDLNNKVKTANNIQIDFSGLFLAVLCNLNDTEDENNNNKSVIKYRNNNIILFELGTGNVACCLNYINPISKLIFDYVGNYMIIGGEKGEISLWKLPENISYNIKNVLNEMKYNFYFWDDYEIKYDNVNNNYKNDVLNNSNYVINKKYKTFSADDQIKHNVQFNSKTYRKDDFSNNNITSYSNFSSNNYIRNKNKNDKSSNILDDKNIFSDISSKNYISNKNENISFKDNTNNNFNSFTNYEKENTKKAPLLIDSNQLLQKKEKEKIKTKENRLFKKNEYKEDNDDINKIKENENNEDNDIEEKRYINNNFLRKRKENNNDIDKETNSKNNFIRKGINDNILLDNINNINNEKDINNIKVDENENDNINQINKKENNNYINSYKNTNTENNNTNNKFNYSKNNIQSNNNSTKKIKRIINTTRPSLNKRANNSFKYFGFNTTYEEKVPKLKYINIVNTNNNIENNYFPTFSNKNSQESRILSFKDKKAAERQKNIKAAINQLLDNNIPINTFEQEKNIRLTIQSEHHSQKKIDNNIKNMNFSQNEINEDFVIINNQKILKNKNKTEKSLDENININTEIRNNIGMDKNKKYPEPDDIDENLVNSKIDPIPDIEQHNQIKKIEIDDMNQFDSNNNDNENVDVNMERKKNNHIKNKIDHDDNNFFNEN